MGSVFFSDGTVPLRTLRDNIKSAIPCIANRWHRAEMTLILKQIEEALEAGQDCVFKL